MNIITKGAIAIAATIAISTTANADYTLFNGVVKAYGNVTESAGQVTDVGNWECFTFFPGTPGYNYLTTIDIANGTFVVSSMQSFTNGTYAPPTFLSGTFTATQNSVSGQNFVYNGLVTFTSGDWMDDLALQLGDPSATSISGTFTTGGVLGANGNPYFSSTGVNAYNLTVGVPEPGEWAAMGMLASGLGGLVIRARRRKLA